MPLTCECDWEPEAGDWYFTDVDDYAPLTTKRARRCSSCNCLVVVGELCVRVQRVKVPEYEIEVRIYGEEEMPIASIYMCERCADLFFSLTELGFCGYPSEDQRKLVKEYAETYGPGTAP